VGAAEPVGAAGFAHLVPPQVIAYVKPFVFLYALAADIAIILLEVFKQRFCIIESFFLGGHRLPFTRIIPEAPFDCKKFRAEKLLSFLPET
jgi:hypothetical protein